MYEPNQEGLKEQNSIQELLEGTGWSLRSQRPTNLELIHQDGSIATRQAAKIVLEYLRSEK